MNLQIAWLGLLLGMVPYGVQAQPWEFDEPIEIKSSNSGQLFHHLESSGRHNIAVSADTVAVVWEDNRDGTPRIYLARKAGNNKDFSREDKISGAGEAYEPTIVALDNNRFAVAWEEDARIHLRLVTPIGLSPVIILGKDEAMQASLASHNQQLLLVYSQRDGRYGRIRMQHIKIDGQTLHVKQGCAVDSEPVQDQQLYPTVVIVSDGVIVAWEDRRLGHTVIMAAQSDDLTTCQFRLPQRVSEELPGHSTTYGKGYGVARVALAQYGNGRLLAAWADKRDFREGYDVYSAHYQPGNKQLFGANTKVQDSFGGVAHQWHVTVAGNPSGMLVVGWDDKRDGNANIMLSWPEDNGWSEDFAVPGAEGPGEQNHPSIFLDREGNLHLAWIERTTVSGPTRIRYLFGRVIK